MLEETTWGLEVKLGGRALWLCRHPLKVELKCLHMTTGGIHHRQLMRLQG